MGIILPTILQFRHGMSIIQSIFMQESIDCRGLGATSIMIIPVSIYLRSCPHVYNA